ncbi:MAG TPA: ATP-dependent helicase, partial [Candidatus Bathyarchaeia archaeon]|nr:ATP-dependent helicase [Candidatus Bathyarchaeia archaeon]
CRILEMLAQLSNGQQILAVTFTNKAAQEMRARLAPQVGDVDKKFFIGTFHQFCLSMLRDRLGREVEVASPEKSLEMAQVLWPGLLKQEYKRRLERMSWWKAVAFELAKPVEVSKYIEAMRARDLYDFDDLLLETVRCLEQDGGLRHSLQQTYAHLFVDEYQDINPIQHRLLTLLTGKQNTLTAIGDPNQAIYGFRGSDVRFFHSFGHDFPGAEILSLQENFRSAPNLVSASGQMIRPDASPDVPSQVARIYAQGQLTVHAAPTDKAEAEYVVHTIEQLVGGTSMFSQDSGRVESHQQGQLSFGDIAVLYRLKSQAHQLEKAFARSGMPYHVVGKSVNDQDLDDDLFAQRQADEDVVAEKVLLMSLHASKGLEFPCVFVCGCEDGLVPLNLFELASDLAEERRLLYVGMTRAKERLYLTHARKRMLYGKHLSLEPSRFLQDIEESLKQHSRSEFKKKRPEPDDGQMTLF